MERGIVLSITMAGGYCTVKKSDGATVKATWLQDWPPPPRSIVWLDQPVAGVWLVAGVEPRQKVMFHEEFSMIQSSNIAATFSYADTVWYCDAVTGAGFYQYATGGSSESGSIAALDGGAAAGLYTIARKGYTAAPTTGAIWTSARVMLSSTATMIGLVGDATMIGGMIGGGVGNYGCYMRTDILTSNNWILFTMNNGAQSFTSTNIPIAANTWFDLDLLWSPVGPWCAAWINGIGPTPSYTNVPPGNVEMEAGMVCYSGGVGGVALNFWVDYYHREWVSSVVPL